MGDPVPPKPVHPLEGKTWFRFAKVIFILLIIVGLGASFLIGMASDNGMYGVIAAIAAVGLLVALRMVFYYIMLGRTTATELQKDSVILTWMSSKETLSLRDDEPELYRTMVVPLFQEWRTQYGRRVPSHLMASLLKRTDQELSKLRQQKEQMVAKAAREGKTIEISHSRASMEKAKADYTGADRVSYCSGIDNSVFKLEAKYGTTIPFEDSTTNLKRIGSCLPESERSL